MAVHQLHHRPELDNIRYAYDSDRSYHSDFESERSYHQSHSDSDRSTQPTVYSASSARRPPRLHYNTYEQNITDEQDVRFFTDKPREESPRASVESYTSSIEAEDEVSPDDPPEYDIPEMKGRPCEPSAAIPATPSDFSELFPSHRRLLIRHDDSTLDGNMNLRIDTEVTMHGGRRRDMTLFHLRMHDLRDREFSLRRYCRDSGREVCHSSCKKQQKRVSNKRPGFQRSLSNALSSMRSRPEQKSITMASLKRNDSGYGSMHSSIDFDRDDLSRSAETAPKSQQQSDSNSIKLEFSNYAQVDVKRTGVKGHRRYEFEYWGTQYAWSRVVRKDSQLKHISYHLMKASSEAPLAYIVEAPLTAVQAEEEQNKGGWISPSFMELVDESLTRGQKDIADAVVASGLIALVDDSINTRFHSKDAKLMLIPKLGFEYVGPKRLINEMFKRESSGSHSRQHSRQSSSSHPTSQPSTSSGSATRKTTGAVRQPSSEY